MKSYKINVPANQEMDDWFEFINESLKHNSEVNNLIVDFNYVNFLHTDDFVVLACLIESFYIKGANVSFIGGTTTEKFYGDSGQKSIDPVVFFKTCLVGILRISLLIVD